MKKTAQKISEKEFWHCQVSKYGSRLEECIRFPESKGRLKPSHPFPPKHLPPTDNPTDKELLKSDRQLPKLDNFIIAPTKREESWIL